MTEGDIDVVFALHDSNGKYWVNTAVAMASVALHAGVPVHFRVVHDETLSPDAQARLRAIVARLGHRLSLHSFAMPPGLEAKALNRLTKGANYRLALPRLFPQSELLVYLDSDLVANGMDIAGLAAAVHADTPLAAVIDPYIDIAASHRESLQRLGLSAATYVNSGVLAMRPRLIPEDLLQQFARFHERFGSTPHADQDFINVHFGGRMQLLDARFNFQACAYRRSLFLPFANYQGKIVHYAGPVKPLDRVLCTGTLPFWMHAALVPEIGSVVAAPGDMRYLYPDPKFVDRIHAQPIRGYRPTA